MKTTINPGFNMSEADVLDLVQQVQSELATALNKSEQTLAKSDEEGGEKSKSEPPAPEGEGAGGPPPSEPPPGAGAPPSEPPPGAGAPPSEPPPGEPPPGEPGAGGPGAGPSFEELVTLYSQLPPEDFEAHAAAIQQAAQMKSAGGPGAGAGAPPSPAPAPSAPPPSAPPPGAPAFKSEAEVKELKGVVADLKKTVDLQKEALEALGKVVTIPQRKAVSGLTFVPMAKTEETKPSRKPFEQMTRPELHNALTEMTAGPGLKKSERDLITGFYQGSVRREALADLFKDQK